MTNTFESDVEEVYDECCKDRNAAALHARVWLERDGPWIDWHATPWCKRYAELTPEEFGVQLEETMHIEVIDPWTKEVL